ncbi:MAG: glutathione S-transferase N-terminal domain-containing protein [Alphaproteobacteria bacterium]|nr:glutathione S-transferase N-terminal domain-containing protein [Alphaproteobacteria bacterium]MCZ6840442.1 glutathione S-transferase N-terminal domain-containing protein [Alphaproteobacteria bacterium]
MIDFHTWTTPNGRKVAIMLEETGLEYKMIPINIGNDEQFAPDFLKIAPNNRIPAIVDHDNNDFSLMETGAILLYLAEKTGQFLNSTDRDVYWRTMEWLMWQMGGVGPMFGQVHHFTKYNAGKAPYAQERYEKEARRLYGVLDRQLDGREYIVDDYSIADMAVWPWTARHDWQEIDLNDYPNVRRWYMTMFDRPAVQRGWNIPETDQPIPVPE